MRGNLPPFLQYVFIAWCSISQGYVLMAWYLVKPFSSHRYSFADFNLNLGVRCETFTSSWKRTAVAPVFKHGNDITVSNYTPISILNDFPKCFNLSGNFSLRHRVQTGSGAHSTSYPMGTRGSFPGGKAAGA
jgi:hypothetical protein